MNVVLLWIGRLAGLLGVVIFAAACLARAASVWRLGSFQVSAVLQGGLALMVLGALAYAAHIAERRIE